MSPLPPRQRLPLLLLLLSAVIFAFHRYHKTSNRPTLHICPLSHVDPAWKLTTSSTYHTLFVPILKQTMLELMLDERRTFTVEPVAFLERFMLHVGPSPISASVGGFESPIEMYAAAVMHSLAKRAGGLEQGVKQTERAYDASKLWRWQLLPLKHIQDIAAVLHDHEGGGEDERADSIEHLLTETDAMSSVLTLFTHGATSDFSDPALSKFLKDYDVELVRLKEITRQGGTHGSRRWDEKSLTALIARSALICGAKNENGCVHSCEVLLKTVGAPTPNAPTDATNSADSTPDQPHLAGLIDHSTCKIPSYATLFKYLTSKTRQVRRGKTKVARRRRFFAVYLARHIMRYLSFLRSTPIPPTLRF
jgi:hypothetical protein